LIIFFPLTPPPPLPTLFPYTTLFRSHGHVDDLARFVNPATVVTILENDPKDPNYAALQENLALLKTMKDQDGRALRVETLPMPAPVYFDGQRLPASYANFYIANKIVIMPTFNDPND